MQQLQTKHITGQRLPVQGQYLEHPFKPLTSVHKWHLLSALGLLRISTEIDYGLRDIMCLQGVPRLSRKQHFMWKQSCLESWVWTKITVNSIGYHFPSSPCILRIMLFLLGFSLLILTVTLWGDTIIDPILLMREMGLGEIKLLDRDLTTVESRGDEAEIPPMAEYS